MNTAMPNNTKQMSNNAILTSRDKEILREEISPNDYADFENREAKIRYRVRLRSQALAEEINLLKEAGETAVVDDFCQTLTDEIDCLEHTDIEEKLRRIEKDLDRLESQHSDIKSLRAELDSVRNELDISI